VLFRATVTGRSSSAHVAELNRVLDEYARQQIDAGVGSREPIGSRSNGAC